MIIVLNLVGWIQVNLASVVVQFPSHVWLFVTPWTAARQASLSIRNSWSLLKLMSIESVMPSNRLILCCPLLLPRSIFLSIWLFSNELILHIRWPKYWSFSFSIRPSNEYSGLIFLGNKLVWSPYSQGNSQESSPIPQFKSINSSVISLVYGPALIHDYQKTIVLTFGGLCQQSDVSAF